jgi:hypothetical protein
MSIREKVIRVTFWAVGGALLIHKVLPNTQLFGTWDLLNELDEWLSL